MLAEEYAHVNPEKHIDVQGGGSSAGIQAVESDTAELGMSSRSLKESEHHLWSIVIAKDGLAIIVNPNNPVVNLTIDELRGIYSANYVNWNQLGGPDARIHIITREEGSGTRSAFEEMVMGEHRITPRAIVQDSNGAVRQLVSADPYSIGFISLGLVDIGERFVKALRIDGVAATRNNVLNGDYTLYRSFLFVAKERPTGNVMEFIDYIRSPEGQQVLANEGLIPEFGIND
jgi:phosphate transport system substrate-binding protein